MNKLNSNEDLLIFIDNAPAACTKNKIINKYSKIEQDQTI